MVSRRSSTQMGLASGRVGSGRGDGATSRQSRYDSAVRKKRIYQDGIKQIIKDAFREFRGHELNEDQLCLFEARVCQANYMLS